VWLRLELFSLPYAGLGYILELWKTSRTRHIRSVIGVLELNCDIPVPAHDKNSTRIFKSNPSGHVQNRMSQF